MNTTARFAILILCWNIGVDPVSAQSPTPTPYPDFLLDHNQDGVIDSRDLLILIRRWGLQDIVTPTPSPTLTPTDTSIPPPTETFTSTPTPSVTETPTSTSTHTPTSTETATPEPTETATETPTPEPTETPTNPNPLTFELPGPTFSMVLIPAGSFLMGSPDTERSRAPDEGPVHQVTIGNDFYLGETEVTQGQWEAVMGSNPATSVGVGRDYPVYNVSWDDCQAFLAALNALGQGTFRLPSEAEWEYACRAGTTTRFYFGDSLGCADACENCVAIKGPILLPLRSQYMWHCGNSEGSAHPVRQKFMNGFGFFDMAGNVFEWCQDSYHSDYTGAPNDGSAWEAGGDSSRVARGGGWYDQARICRSAARAVSAGADGGVNIGFRLARTP